MTSFDKLFRKTRIQPEALYAVTITDEAITVTHPKQTKESISWDEIDSIILINTDEGPLLPDVWLTLSGNDKYCMIPQGCAGFEKVYEIVSKYDGFNFDNVHKSMTCTENEKFTLWVKSN